MSNQQLGEMRYIDARNLLCPLPILKLRKALLNVDIGAFVEIETTDPVAAIDIPHFCHEENQALVETINKETSIRFIIKRLI